MILSICITVFWLILLWINHGRLTAMERQLAQTLKEGEAWESRLMPPQQSDKNRSVLCNRSGAIRVTTINHDPKEQL